jgi:hypothetical protein
MPIETICELELTGRGQGWTDVSAELGDQNIKIFHGIRGNGIADRTSGAGNANFELVNQNPAGKYSLRHADKRAGFGLGIGVRLRLTTTTPQGDGAGYLVDNAGGYAPGATTVDVDSGSGLILEHDLVTFAGVPGVYRVLEADDPLTAMTIEPGLADAVANNAAVTPVGRSFTRHVGRLDRVTPAPGVFERRTVRCVSVDWMDDAARAKISGIPVQLGKRADEIFEQLVAAVPFSPNAIQADESPDTYAYALDGAQDERSSVLSELSRLALSELGLVYTKADGTVVFESRNRRALSQGVVDTFVDTNALSGFSAPVSRNDSLSRVQIITHPRKVDADNATVLFRLDNPIEVGAGSSITVLCPYRDPAQEASRVGGVDMQTLVPVDRYSANSQQDGQGTDLTSIFALTPIFGGNGASILIENNASSTGWVTALTLLGRGIYDYQNLVLEASNSEAQLNIGTTATADMPYQDNAALGHEIALWLLNLYRDIETLAESAMVVVPRTDEALASRVLSREISDRIGIVEQMTGFVAEETGGHFIQSVTLTIDARNNLSVSWGLAPANRQQFWLLEIPGRSELDETTVLGFGLVVGHTDVSHCDTHDDASHSDVAHDDEHGDVHSDSEHQDSAHTDSHDDVAHADTAHTDTHSDVAHSDKSHNDSHSDVAHSDSHDDVSHVDVAHGDIEHADHIDS